MAEGVVDFAYSRQYAGTGLPLRDRYLATIAALTALGGQTRPQIMVTQEWQLFAPQCNKEKHAIAEILCCVHA
jgi:alkylhydroperoxidase/carboxymuconolactone decarboxylase family protein YurZ